MQKPERKENIFNACGIRTGGLHHSGCITGQVEVALSYSPTEFSALFSRAEWGRF